MDLRAHTLPRHHPPRGLRLLATREGAPRVLHSVVFGSPGLKPDPWCSVLTLSLKNCLAPGKTLHLLVSRRARCSTGQCHVHPAGLRQGWRGLPEWAQESAWARGLRALAAQNPRTPAAVSPQGAPHPQVRSQCLPEQRCVALRKTAHEHSRLEPRVCAARPVTALPGPSCHRL